MNRLEKPFQPDASHLPKDHPPVQWGRIGVLLVNLGTPDATDFWSMRRYLKEFLSDKRVIEENTLVWKLVFNGIILTTRPRAKGRDYDTIWNREKNEGPLKTITRSQSDKLAAMLGNGRIVVDWAMRYGNPSIASRIEVLAAQGCERLLIAPLYPQYAAATTATVCDEAFRQLMRMRWQPTLRVAPPYHDDPVYIDAVVSSLRTELAKLPFQPEVILASYHGIPKEYFDKGDPYHCHCAKTTRLMREALGMDERKLLMTFQSRFGRAEWLQPYTDKTVEALAKSGVRSLAIITPGFSVDCLETLEEIAVENGDIFRANGGQNFAAIPCLNDSDLGMAVIRHLVERELLGWL
ncbi:MAG: ferrochelatase [Pseudorhodoplanes sp.]|jgi:ferrochelatase|nr:ferrochelatase [Pseudorhodoplanes sp.]